MQKGVYILTCFLQIFIIEKALNITFPANENDTSCKINSTDKIGTCKKLRNCPSALARFSSVRPQLCYFEKDEPIVCCPDELQHLPEMMNNISKFISVTRCKEIYYRQSFVCPDYINCAFGGLQSDYLEFPYMAAIGWMGDDKTIDFKCGGFLIDKTYVITAAHCLRTIPNIVRLGGLPLFKRILLPSDIEVSETFIHPNYDPRQGYHDIAILQLARESDDDLSKPACLYNEETIRTPYLTAIGFGDTTYGGAGSDVLIKLNLTVYGNEVCQQNFPIDNKLSNGIVRSHLCAGHPNGEQDTCAGDSGGPIGALIGAEFDSSLTVSYVMGITSFGQGCGGATAAVYTRISSYLDWIVSTVWPNYDMSGN